MPLLAPPPVIAPGPLPGGVRAMLSRIVPPWLANRAGKNVGFKIMWAFAVMLDAAIEAVTEGVLAAYPGVGTSTALGLIGQSRGMVQGPNESNASFATRLVSWLLTWSRAGSDAVLAGIIQAYATLPNTAPPAITIVDRSGNWTLLAPNGAVTFAKQTWDWDSKSHPWRAGFWSDIWIIVTPDSFTNYGILGTHTWPWGAARNVNGWGWGHEVTRQGVADIWALARAWKGAHVWVRAIIWNNAGTSFFNPSVPANLPDGHWGNWSKNVAGSQVPSRNLSARYWDSPTGFSP